MDPLPKFLAKTSWAIPLAFSTYVHLHNVDGPFIPPNYDPWVRLRTCDDEIDSCPLENADLVVVVDAEEEHGDEEDGDQHGDQRQRVEELSRNHERWK